MWGWESWEIVFASRSKRWRSSSSEVRCSGRTLTATSRSEPRVPRPVDLAHPARADRRKDLVGTEPRPCCQRHVASCPNRVIML